MWVITMWIIMLLYSIYYTTYYCAGIIYTGYTLAEEHNLRDRLYCTVHKVPRDVPRQDHCVCQTGSRAVTDGDHTVLSDPSIVLGCHTVLLCQKCSQSVPKCRSCISSSTVLGKQPNIAEGLRPCVVTWRD